MTDTEHRTSSSNEEAAVSTATQAASWCDVAKMGTTSLLKFLLNTAL